jgi:AcrR family transcriptional regulator
MYREIIQGARRVNIGDTQMSDEKRVYRKSARAEQEAETRERITAAAVALHEKLGPAHTPMSLVAEQAGVPRSTLYRHFADDTALLVACNDHWLARHPVPDPSGWPAIVDRADRTETALRALYAYFRKAAPMLDKSLRDEKALPALHKLLRGYHGYIDAVREMLVPGRASKKERAAVGHALRLSTWQSLHEEGLSDAEAASLVTRWVISNGTGPT